MKDWQFWYFMCVLSFGFGFILSGIACGIMAIINSPQG